MIWLMNFPLPPSVNDYLMPVAGKLKMNKKGKLYRAGHFVKTPVHIEYRKLCNLWVLQHKRAFDEIQNHLLGRVHVAREKKQRIAFRVDHYFAFEESRIWTVNNLPERIDADNRVKPCRDAIADMLGIDDKYFFSGFFEKVSTNSKDSECTAIRISQMVPRTLQDLKQQMEQERTASSSSGSGSTM